MSTFRVIQMDHAMIMLPYGDHIMALSFPVPPRCKVVVGQVQSLDAHGGLEIFQAAMQLVVRPHGPNIKHQQPRRSRDSWKIHACPPPAPPKNEVFLGIQFFQTPPFRLSSIAKGQDEHFQLWQAPETWPGVMRCFMMIDLFGGFHKWGYPEIDGL